MHQFLSVYEKQNVATLSSYEVGHITSTKATRQFLLLKNLLELKLEHQKPVQLFVDNKYAISLSNFPWCE